MLYLCHDLLDTGRMDAPVSHQLMQCKPAYLAPNRVKGTDYDGLWRVINHNLHTSGGFQCPNVSSFAANDTPLHLVILYMEYSDTVFHSCLRGHTLNGLDNNSLGFFVCSQLGIIHDFIDISLCAGLCLVGH